MAPLGLSSPRSIQARHSRMRCVTDAAVKPNIRNYVNNIATRLREFSSVEGERRDIPFYVMKSNGGVLSAKEVVHQPITTVLSGPAAGALGEVR